MMMFLLDVLAVSEKFFYELVLFLFLFLLNPSLSAGCDLDLVL